MAIALALTVSPLSALAASPPPPARPRAPRPTQPPPRAEEVAAVAEAIQAAHAGLQFGWVQLGSVKPGDFMVFVNGPLGRIAMEAQQAAKNYRPFLLDDVAAGYSRDRERSINVAALPADPEYVDGRGWVVAPIPTEIVIQPLGLKDPAHTIRSTSTRSSPASWTTAMGGRFSGAQLTATFARDVFAGLSPTAELEIVVLTQDDERRYLLNHTRRAEVR